jgi:FtsX-like permease family protein
MKLLRLLGLGIKLALSGGRTGRTRMLLMSVGLAFGVALMLGALGIQPAIHAHDNREAARSNTIHGPRRLIRDATFEWRMGTTFKGQSVLVIAVTPLGRAPVPPGLPRLPGEGEVFESPALAELLAAPDGALLRPRIPGTSVGIVGPQGLLDPSELVAYVGASPSFDLRPRDATIFTSFDQRSPVSHFDIGIVIMLVAIVITMAIPIALFVLTITRLSTATREARLAAVRLAGGTQSQVGILAAAESGLAAVAGCVLGLPTFLLARRIVASLAIPGYRLFPGDLAPPPSVTAALLIGLPLFAVGVSVLTMRRVVVSPLGIARRVRRIRRGWPWPVSLVAGIAVLAVGAAGRTRLLEQPSPIPGVIIGAGLALVLIGLAGTAPWLGWRLSGWVASKGPGPSVLLGTRRLEAEPASSGRIASGVAVLVGIVVVAQTILIGSNDGIDLVSGTKGLRPEQVVATQYGHPGTLRALDRVPGVRAVTLSRKSPFGGTTCRGCLAIIDTDGRPETVERVRNALMWTNGYAETAGELRASVGSGTQSRWVRLLELAMLLLLVVTGVSILISTVDGLMERRRPIAALSAMGVPTGVIRRSVLVQIALPLSIGLTLGAASGLLVTKLVFVIADLTPVLPMNQLMVTTAAVAVIVLLATAASLPWVRVSRRPELLRTE